MVTTMGVLWSATDFRYEPALYERRETRSGSAKRHSDSRGDLRR